MPDYKRHIGIGLMAYVVVLFTAYYYNLASIWTLLFCLPGMVIASTFPDIDTPASKARKWTERVLLFTAIVLIISGVIQNKQSLMLAAILPILFVLILWSIKHRGPTHDPLAALLLPAPLLLLGISSNYPFITYGLPFYATAVIGYLSHLVADYFLKN
jgi:membrane-bound metal-dependent hydrolase YbcI (DUF457 family)